MSSLGYILAAIDDKFREVEVNTTVIPGFSACLTIFMNLSPRRTSLLFLSILSVKDTCLLNNADKITLDCFDS